jgi:hypothetical protein
MPAAYLLGGGLPLLTPLTSDDMPWTVTVALAAFSLVLLTVSHVVDRVLTYRMYLAALPKVRDDVPLRDLATVLRAGQSPPAG